MSIGISFFDRCNWIVFHALFEWFFEFLLLNALQNLLHPLVEFDITAYLLTQRETLLDISHILVDFVSNILWEVSHFLTWLSLVIVCTRIQPVPLILWMWTQCAFYIELHTKRMCSSGISWFPLHTICRLSQVRRWEPSHRVSETKSRT